LEVSEALKEISYNLNDKDAGGSVITIAEYYDMNKDKHLSYEEFCAFLEDIGFLVSKTLSRNIFDQFDINHNQGVDYWEFIITVNKAGQASGSNPNRFRRSTDDFRGGLFLNRSFMTLGRGLVLYFIDGDAPSWIVRLLLEEMGLEHTRKELKTVDGTFIEVFNPRGTAPMLLDGEIGVFETPAIIHYLLTVLSNEKGQKLQAALPLFPSFQQKSDYAVVTTRVHETSHLAQMLSSSDTPNEALEAELAHWENYLGKANYVAGNSFTVADIAFFPFLALLVKRNFTLSANLQEYYQTISQRGAVQQTWPSSFPSPSTETETEA